MKGREGKGPPSTDLLVCFPSRAHLKLMPKPICSPARPSEPPNKHHHHSNISSHHHNKKKSSSRNGILWAKNKQMISSSKEIIHDEPTSPKVTCAGQIKVKSKAKNWQSIMEEIERLHNNNSQTKHKKRSKPSSAVEALGFKKDFMQFLTCLTSNRFDFRCFGAFASTPAITTSDDDEEDEDEDDDDLDEYQNHDHEDIIAREDSSSENSKTVFSKWLMVLQENHNITNNREIEQESVDQEPTSGPPTNALLLMRCRSAPAKRWLEEKEEEEEENDEEEESHDDNKQEGDEKRIKKTATEEEEKKKREEDKLIVMRCGTDFYKFSSDIAKETWVVGGIRDKLSRSQSWKR
ncbi:hypothetical protein ACH5RR_034560 [Cinchona calisaya]|uniref:Uncharacterized protein n=1 Tax=Cinchona calisaya TaxID=153742 RepID=A0ABD2YB95_9GENT